MKKAVTSSFNSSFSDGGYYRVDIDDSLSVLALNTLYYGIHCDESKVGKEGLNQMKWLQDNLKEDRQFLMFMHIWPGINYYGQGHPLHWKQKYVKDFYSILKTHRDQLPIIVGAHTHFGNFVYQSEQVNQSLRAKLVNLIKRR